MNSTRTRAFFTTHLFALLISSCEAPPPDSSAVEPRWTTAVRTEHRIYAVSADGLRTEVPILAAGMASDEVESFLVAAPPGELLLVRETTPADGTGGETTEEPIAGDATLDAAGELPELSETGMTGGLTYAWVVRRGGALERWNTGVSAEGHTWADEDLDSNETVCDADSCLATVAYSGRNGTRWLAVYRDPSGPSSREFDGPLSVVNSARLLESIQDESRSLASLVGFRLRSPDGWVVLDEARRHSTTILDDKLVILQSERRSRTMLAELSGSLSHGGVEYRDTLLSISVTDTGFVIHDEGPRMCEGELCAVAGSSPVVFAHAEPDSDHIDITVGGGSGASDRIALPAGATVTSIQAVRDGASADTVDFVAVIARKHIGMTTYEVISFRVNKNTGGPIWTQRVNKNTGGPIWTQRVGGISADGSMSADGSIVVVDWAADDLSDDARARLNVAIISEDISDDLTEVARGSAPVWGFEVDGLPPTARIIDVSYETLLPTPTIELRWRGFRWTASDPLQDLGEATP